LSEKKPVSPKPKLDPFSREFCFQIAGFCQRHDIPGRQLSRMVGGDRNRLGSTSIHRVLHGEADANTVERFRRYVAPALVEYLEDCGYSPTDIETELSPIFDPKEFMKMIANRCPLSPEAVRFFGLKSDPFDVDHLPAADEIFTNKEIDNVVARVKDAVLYQRFVAVVGSVGSGKTLLKLRVANELAGEGKTRLLYPEFFDMEELSVPNIANAILAELGQTIPRDKSQRVARMKETLTQLQQEGIGVAVILDEGHRLRDKVLSSLKNFWEMTNGRNARLLGVILFGQPQLVENRLRDTRFKEIRQRVQVIAMPEFTRKDEGKNANIRAAQDYIGHRLKLAGGDIAKLFETEAVRRICINASTPLALGNLVNEALMEAFRLEETHVTASMEFFKKLNAGTQVLGMRRSAA